jgi:hypothetical protein
MSRIIIRSTYGLYGTYSIDGIGTVGIEEMYLAHGFIRCGIVSTKRNMSSGIGSATTIGHKSISTITIGTGTTEPTYS